MVLDVGRQALPCWGSLPLAETVSLMTLVVAGHVWTVWKPNLCTGAQTNTPWKPQQQRQCVKRVYKFKTSRP